MSIKFKITKNDTYLSLIKYYVKYSIIIHVKIITNCTKIKYYLTYLILGRAGHMQTVFSTSSVEFFSSMQIQQNRKSYR